MTPRPPILRLPSEIIIEIAEYLFLEALELEDMFFPYGLFHLAVSHPTFSGIIHENKNRIFLPIESSTFSPKVVCVSCCHVLPQPGGALLTTMLYNASIAPWKVPADVPPVLKISYLQFRKLFDLYFKTPALLEDWHNRDLTPGMRLLYGDYFSVAAVWAARYLCYGADKFDFGLWLRWRTAVTGQAETRDDKRYLCEAKLLNRLVLKRVRRKLKINSREMGKLVHHGVKSAFFKRIGVTGIRYLLRTEDEEDVEWYRERLEECKVVVREDSTLWSIRTLFEEDCGPHI